MTENQDHQLHPDGAPGELSVFMRTVFGDAEFERRKAAEAAIRKLEHSREVARTLIVQSVATVFVLSVLFFCWFMVKELV